MIMGKRKQSKPLKTLLSLFLLLRPRSASSIRLSLLLTTSHTPPSPSSLSSFLSLASSCPRPTASLSISSLMDRLCSTSSAHVALKCLIVVHHIIAHGNFILRDQLIYYPVNGGRNFLNMSGFRDNETWELSGWVRFYSCYLESNLIACRKLGVFISSTNKNINIVGYEEIGSSNLSNGELMCEVEVLVDLIEEICKVPGSFCDYKSSLVHEVLKLLSEDYGHVQRFLSSRLSEFNDRVTELNRTEQDELAGLMRKVEGCRERVTEVFGNRKRNDAFWELVGMTRGELTRFKGRVGKVSELIWVERVNGAVVPAPWHDVLVKKCDSVCL